MSQLLVRPNVVPIKFSADCLLSELATKNKRPSCMPQFHSGYFCLWSVKDKYVYFYMKVLCPSGRKGTWDLIISTQE